MKSLSKGLIEFGSIDGYRITWSNLENVGTIYVISIASRLQLNEAWTNFDQKILIWQHVFFDTSAVEQ